MVARMVGIRSAICAGAILWTAAAIAQEEALTERREEIGAAVGPAVLPAGATAVYGYVGLPELATGFRQGFGRFELEVRTRVDYFRLSFAVEGVGKLLVMHSGGLEVAPYLGVGALANSGLMYLDPLNYPFLGVRLFAGGVVSLKLGESAQALGLLEVPFNLPIRSGGPFRVQPLIGAGIELALSEEFTGLLLGRIGADVIRPPNADAVARFGYEIRIGFGYRIF